MQKSYVEFKFFKQAKFEKERKKQNFFLRERET